MDPSKPASTKPKVGSAAGSLPQAASANVQPKKSFEATLAEKKKPNVTASRTQSDKNPVLAAIEQATGQNDDLERGLRIAEEQMAIQMSRSILSAPKPSKNGIQREKSDAEEDV
jgi:hypothetical protein